MTSVRKRFVQLWERQVKHAVRLPAAFCFTPDGKDGWRCYFGRVGTVRRSRVSLYGSTVYGFVSARELSPRDTTAPVSTSEMSHNRYIRCRIIDRIKKPPLAPAARPAEIPAASPGMAVAGMTGNEQVSLL